MTVNAAGTEGFFELCRSRRGGAGRGGALGSTVLDEQDVLCGKLNSNFARLLLAESSSCVRYYMFETFTGS
jgi:hypothetical protein